MWKKSMLLTAMLLLWYAAAFSADRTISAVSDPWPPFVDPEHPQQGLSMEIVRAVFKSQGYEVTMRFLPWARAESGVRTGVFDILPNTWMTADRREVFLFSEAYTENRIVFIKRKGDWFEYNGLESLEGFVVGVVRGYGYEDAFLNAPGFVREEAADFLTNIRKLLNQRIDLTLEDEIVARHLLLKNGEDLIDRIEFVTAPLVVKKLYVVCGFQNPSHREIIDAFNRGLKTIKASGIYDSIIDSFNMRKEPVHQEVFENPET